MYTKCFKYRIYPTGRQQRLLSDTLETCRQVYNSLLNSRKHDYEVHGKSPSRVEQINTLPLLRKQFPEIAAVHSQVLQNVAFRVDLAYRAFFRRVKIGDVPGFPRFKGEGYDSFTFPQSGFKIEQGAVSVSLGGKQETIKAVLHREVVGRIKTCNVRRQAGKWFVCFACEYDPDPLPASELAVGIDVGITHFAALSDGSFVDNPRFFRTDLAGLAKSQRRVSQAKRGSTARRKAKKVVSRVNERIRNRRHDFCHQAARRIVNKFGLIVVEDLQIKNMSRSPATKQDEETGEYLPNGASQKAGLNKSILDAAWGMFLSVTQSKAESAAREYMKRNPAYTSQDCYKCGRRAKKKLSERWHNCPNCAASLDRDTNSGLNLVLDGLKNCVGQYTVAGMPA